MKYIVFSAFLLILFSCSKPNDGPGDGQSLQGTWVFVKEVSTTIWNWSAVHDSILISFDNTGKYKYSQYSSYPVDKGAFSIVQDSVLVLQSDTAYSTFYSFTHNLVYGNLPDASYSYIGDKYIFSKPDNNQLIIERQWFISSTSTLPSKSAFYFKRKL